MTQSGQGDSGVSCLSYVRKKFLLKEIPGERSSLWNSMVSKCKTWNFCSHVGTMKGTRLGVNLESWKAEQKERRTQVPDGNGIAESLNQISSVLALPTTGLLVM